MNIGKTILFRFALVQESQGETKVFQGQERLRENLSSFILQSMKKRRISFLAWHNYSQIIVLSEKNVVYGSLLIDCDAPNLLETKGINVEVKNVDSVQNMPKEIQKYEIQSRRESFESQGFLRFLMNITWS